MYVTATKMPVKGKQISQWFGIAILLLWTVTASAFALDVCDQLSIDPGASKPLKSVSLPPQLDKCKPSVSHGRPIPDRACSPGAVNPTVTAETLRSKKFTTKCLRNTVTSAAEKAKVYAWYGIQKPPHNYGQDQTCELDHIVSLELGGADTLDNIWPQCGPAGVPLNKRFFKQKDAVENLLATQVREGIITLSVAQRRIAEDWTQFIPWKTDH